MEIPVRFLGPSFVLAFAAALGCTVTPQQGPESPKDTSAAEPEGKAPLPKVTAEHVEPSEPSAGKRKSFDAMSPGERMSFMKKVVFPEMSQLFDSGGEEEHEFGCKTCHGPGAAQGNFKMPNPALPKLDPSDGFADEKKAKPEAVKFMMEQVVPKMAELLGEPVYDPATHEGFGCFECHTKAEPGS